MPLSPDLLLSSHAGKRKGKRNRVWVTDLRQAIGIPVLERAKAKQPLLEAIGWHDSWMNALRANMRRDGYRVRPAKTDRNVQNWIKDFGMKLKMLEMAEALGPFVKEFMEARERRKREREGRLRRR